MVYCVVILDWHDMLVFQKYLVIVANSGEMRKSF